jgi:hypothetical protein
MPAFFAGLLHDVDAADFRTHLGRCGDCQDELYARMQMQLMQKTNPSYNTLYAVHLLSARQLRHERELLRQMRHLISRPLPRATLRRRRPKLRHLFWPVWLTISVAMTVLWAGLEVTGVDATDSPVSLLLLTPALLSLVIDGVAMMVGVRR